MNQAKRLSEERQDVLLVTGGSRGIGAAIVRRAVAHGYSVCFSYLDDESAAASLLDEVRRLGGGARAFKGDVADPAFAPRFFDEAENWLGPVTSLVNNAGVTGRYGAFAHLPAEALRHTIDVNLIGTALVAQETVRRWLTTGRGGRMVNISSVAATLGAPGEYVHYAATKAAVEALTIGLGKEVAAAGIRVNAVAPGTVDTDIHAAAGVPDRPKQVVARVPMRRIARPDEIADVVLWLLSPQASYVTATVVRATGGL
jgi:NAD(P)-dependent dehydrogenase (short-subunit alcohol dehydrogenase family)